MLWYNCLCAITHQLKTFKRFYMISPNKVTKTWACAAGANSKLLWLRAEEVCVKCDQYLDLCYVWFVTFLISPRSRGSTVSKTEMISVNRTRIIQHLHGGSAVVTRATTLRPTSSSTVEELQCPSPVKVYQTRSRGWHFSSNPVGHYSSHDWDGEVWVKMHGAAKQ